MRTFSMFLIVALAAVALRAAPLAPDFWSIADSSSGFGGTGAGLSNHPWFSVRYAADSAHSAGKVRVQVSTDPEFTSVLWDSGFVIIATTAPGSPTPPIEYAGPALSNELQYYWRAAVQTEGGVSGPFSADLWAFRLSASVGACDLRCTTGLGQTVLQGDPVELASPQTPKFAAEYFGDPSELVPTVTEAQIEVSYQSDFRRLVAQSDWTDVGTLSAGMRTPLIPVEFDVRFNTPHFWRIRFRNAAGVTGPWSDSRASFRYVAPVPGVTPPGGFARQAKSFSGVEHPASDLICSDINGNGVLDAVVATGDSNFGHLVFPDVGTAGAGAPWNFGAGRGGRTLLAAANFDADPAFTQEVVIVDQFGVLLYASDGNGGMGLTAESPLEFGEPVAVQVGHVDWDGRPDVIIAYENAIVVLGVLFPEFGPPLVIATTEAAITSMIAHDLVSGKKSPTVEIAYCCEETVFVCFLDGSESHIQEMPGVTHMALATPSDPTSTQLVFAGNSDLSLATFSAGGDLGGYIWIVDKSGPHGLGAPCEVVQAGNLIGDSTSEFVLRLTGMTAVIAQTPDGFALHEYVGHPGGVPDIAVAVCDMDSDTFADIIVGRQGAAHSIFMNRARLATDIHNTFATQVNFGQAWAEFEVTLNAPPVSVVEVQCETYEPEGGDSDYDKVPDSAELARGQLGPLSYVPTVRKLVFVPGQTRSLFQVPLTSHFSASSWILHARIVSVVGAISISTSATAQVYAAASGSSGPPSQAGMQRGWKLRGEVQTMVRAQGRTYFGGLFDGVEWESEKLAVFDASGNQMFKPPQLVSGGEINAVSVDADGNVYIGGRFAIDVPGQPGVQVKNIAKLNPNGSLDPSFRPNPYYQLPNGSIADGRVNAIEFDQWKRVYFGGHFTRLQNAPTSNMQFWNIAVVNPTGPVLSDANRFGVAQAGSGTFGEVYALKIGSSGIGFPPQSDSLVVGGAYLGKVWSHSQFVPGLTISNLAIFSITGSPTVNPHVPRVIGGPVRSLEIMQSSYGTSPTNTIVFGGNFYSVTYGSTPATVWNLSVTNFLGQYPSTLPGSQSAVHAIKKDGANRIWVGRQRNVSYGSGFVDALAVYTLAGGQLSTLPFTSGLNDTVYGLARGENEMLVVGNFSQAGTSPAGRIAAFSAGPSSFGVFRASLRTAVPVTARAAATLVSTAGAFAGYAVCGPFNEFISQRSNLAAIDGQGNLLPWGPDVNGPVYAMATEGVTVFFGGSFTSCGAVTRASLAAAPANTDALQPSAFNLGVTGSLAVVRAIEYDGSSHIYVGGDFTHVGGTTRTDVAKINLSFAAIDAWNANLDTSTSSSVRSIKFEPNPLRVYIGGKFSGTTSTSRPALLATTATNGALIAWDPQMDPAGEVLSISYTAGFVVAVGNFSSAGGESRSGAVALDKSTALASPFQPVPYGSFTSVACTNGGLIYLGGDFLSVAESQAGAANVFQRRGVAVLDTAGVVQTWTANVLSGMSGERVNTIFLDNSAGIDDLWVGGKFTGTPHPGQNDITKFSGAWYITSSSLNPAQSGQPYGPEQIFLSESVPCSWSLQSAAAPGLAINSSGQIVGTAPTLMHGQPPLAAPVLVTADRGGGITCSRWFLLTVYPPPPPTLVSISGPTTLFEGNLPALSPTPQWTISLNQAFGQDVFVSIQYINGLAHAGVEYSAHTQQVKITAGQLSTQFPVTIYGNITPDAPVRDFSMVIASLTSGVQTGIGQILVDIVDDDTPGPRPAYVLMAQLREDPNTPANPLGVVSANPFISWQFGSDIPGETQQTYEVQLALDNTFLSPGLIWSHTPILVPDTDEILQVPVPLVGGTVYFARVRVWAAGGGVASDWRTFWFRKNAAPAPVSNMLPPSTTRVNTTRPLLYWTASGDPDGDPTHYVVHVTEQSGAPAHVLDSRVTPWLFEQETQPLMWVPLSQSGLAIMPGGLPQKMRVRIPASFALAPTPAVWDWWVDVVDPYEKVPGTNVESFEIDPRPIIEGRYIDPSGGAPGPWNVHCVLLPSHTIVRTVTTNPLTGEFTMDVPVGLVAGDLIALCIDPGTPPLLGPFAAIVMRFPGADLLDSTGPLRKVDLVRGTASLDSRELAAMNLGDLRPYATIAGMPFLDPPTPEFELELTPQFSRLELHSELRVRGTSAMAGEPTMLRLGVAGQTCVTLAAGKLTVEEGGVAELRLLENAGETSVLGGAILSLTEHSQSTGAFTLDAQGTLHLNSVDLAASNGHVTLLAGLVTGSGIGSLRVDGGLLTVSGTAFASSGLDIGNVAALSVADAVFAGGANNRCLTWRYPGGGPLSLERLRFDPGVGHNVYADPLASTLTLVGCGGDFAGEAFDFDPGEASGADIVVWQSVAVDSLAGLGGDERVLLLWEAGAQSGANFTFEVFGAQSPTGPFTSLGTTGDTFFVHAPVANGTTYYYFVSLTAWGGQPAASDVVSSTPQDAVLQHSSPLVIGPDGTWPGAAIGADTHFDTSTHVTSTTSGVVISAIVVYSPTLITFDVDTASAAAGQADIQIETPDVWAEHGAPGYNEWLSFQSEIKPVPTPNQPMIAFVQTGGAVGPDDFTDGAFSVAIEFDAQGGAPIEPGTFECYVDRDILVGGQVVPAGTDLAGTTLQLWGTPNAAGATWAVEQQLVNPGSTEEFIAAGEIIINVRVANAFGLVCQWTSLRIFIQGGDTDRAYMSADLLQGVDDQVVTISCIDLQGADHVWFPDDTSITITDIDVLSSTNSIELTVNVGTNARVGSFNFEVGIQGSPPDVKSYGTYHMLRPMEGVTGTGGYVTMSMGSSEPGPRATTAAVNVVLQTGEFRWSTTDLAIPGRRMPLVWDRHYRSDHANDEKPGLLGRGWYNTYLQYVIAHNDDSETTSITWVTATGLRHEFTAVAPQSGEVSRFHPPAGVAALAVGTQSDDDYTTELKLQTEEGLFLYFKRNDSSHTGDKRMRLERIEDAHRNCIQLEYDSSWGCQLVRVVGDSSNRGNSYGDYFEIDYHWNGCIQSVTRRVGTYGGVWSSGTPKERIEYGYSEDDNQLTLLQLPAGHRHGTLFQGYVYSNSSANAPLRLVKIFPPQFTKPLPSTSDLGSLSYYDVDESGSPTPIPSLTVTYDTLGRVVEQLLGPSLGADSRKFTVQYMTDGVPFVWRRIATAAGIITDYTIDSTNGMAVSIVQGGTGVTYAYNSDHALTCVTRPKGDRTYYWYDLGGAATVSGTYNITGTVQGPSIEPPLASTTLSVCTLTGTPPYFDAHAYTGQMVRFVASDGAIRYYRVQPGSTGNSLRVVGDVLAQGMAWGTGQFSFFSADPLKKFALAQRRDCKNSEFSTEDPVTTWSWRDVTIQGNKVGTIQEIHDARGNITTINQNDQSYVGHGSHGQTVISTTAKYSQATGPTGNGPQGLLSSITIVDQYGRVVREEDITSDGPSDAERVGVEYEYYDANSTSLDGYRGRVKSSVVVSGGSEHGSKTTYEYDSFGHLKTVITSDDLATGYNQDDYKITYHTNFAGQLYRVEQAHSGLKGTGGGIGGRPDTWFYYDKNGRLEREVSAFKSSLAGNSQPTAGVSDPQNLTTESAIENAFSRPSTLKGAGWVHTVTAYNAHGDVDSVVQDLDVGPIKATTQYTYDKDGRLDVVNDPAGRKTKHKYDNRNLLHKLTGAWQQDGQATFEYVYDDNRNLIEEKSPLGHTVRYEYDGYNRLHRTTSPGGLVEEVRYPKPYEANIARTAWGTLSGTGELDVLRASWEEYDQLGRLIRRYQLAKDKDNTALKPSVTHDGHPCAVEWYKLNGRGELRESYVLQEGNDSGELRELNWYHDPFGRQNSHWTVMEGELEYTYTSSGLMTKTELPQNVWAGDSLTEVRQDIEAQYDPSGQIHTSKDQLDVAVTTQRNNLGWPEKVIDGAQRYTETEYNFAGWPRKMRAGEGSQFTQTEKLYDKTGLVIEETAWVGAPGTGQAQTTSYGYDFHGRLKSLQRPDAGLWEYEYDQDGRLHFEYHRDDNLKLEYVYDAAGDLQQVVICPTGAGPVPLALDMEEFTYNEFGEILTAKTTTAGNVSSQLELEYNSLGLIESQTLNVFDNGQPVEVEFPAHYYPSYKTGFESLYTSNQVFEKGLVNAEYNSEGQPIALEYWDTRRIETVYAAGLPWLVKQKQPEEFFLLTYSWGYGSLAGRSHCGPFSPHHIVTPRPNVDGKSTSSAPWNHGYNYSFVKFQQDPRGVAMGVTHHHRTDGSPTKGKPFSGVEMRYDHSGNPVLQRRLEFGGQSRVMRYDFAGRLDASLRGHLLDLAGTQTLPPVNLPAGSPYLEPLNQSPALHMQHQWRREFTQDTVDNITKITDTRRSGSTDINTATVDQILVGAYFGIDDRNLVESRSDTPKPYDHDDAGRITYDGTTELKYEYNYRGQIQTIKDAADNVIRKMTYDAFGRMVLQIDLPGSSLERGTVFVPNIGFGGDGMGADTAAEVSYIRPVQTEPRVGLEIVQFTYGFGAVGGGIGWKRIIEFVAYCREFAPYYRFLHEDTQGNTIATTSMAGDRLDEYDYTDYGVPLHAPVALDGRWISGITPHQGQPAYPDVSVVSLVDDVLNDNELLGCELRVVKAAPSGPDDVFVTATVISHFGTTLHIHDPGNAVANAWSGCIPYLSGIYDLREGFVKGVVDSVSSGSPYTGNGWFNESCSHLTVDHGAFDSNWMFSSPGSVPLLTVTITNGTQTEVRTVLGTRDYVSGTHSAHRSLVVQGASLPGWVQQGVWYKIDGKAGRRWMAQSGTWTSASSGGTTTIFTIDPHAWVSKHAVGGYLQPDVSVQAYAPIIAVSGQTITVAGNYATPAGKHWRLYAPTGTERFGPAAGMLDDFISAAASRCLYGGYRAESPLAGLPDWTAQPDQTQQPPKVGCQTGWNYAGLQYTLHRHYDPVLMRFTGPDPAASPFHNLHAYCGNNPAGAYDPDGLEIEFTFDGYWGRVKNIFTKGEFEFKLGTDGYSERAGATWEGAAVKTFDTLTLGQVLDDNDRAAMAYKWQSRGLGGYYDAGGFVGSTTVLTALSIATAGAFSGVGATGAVANIGLRSWMAGGAIAGAYGGAADAGIAGGGAMDMLQGAATGAVIGAGSALAGAALGRGIAIAGRGLAATGRALGRVHFRITGMGSGLPPVRIGLRPAGPPRAYSVAYETSIPRVGDGTRPAHFRAANQALLGETRASPQLSAAMQKLGIKVPVNKAGAPLGESPANWTWHHVPHRPGVMQLVPRTQHQSSAYSRLFHPGGVGGFKLWGRDY